MHDQDLHALAAPIETDVAVTPAPGGRPGVYLQAIMALRPGEHYVYNRQLPGTVRLCDLKDELTKVRNNLKGTAGGAIKRAAEKTGLRYNQSTGEMITGDGRVVVYSLITCNGASNDGSRANHAPS